MKVTGATVLLHTFKMVWPFTVLTSAVEFKLASGKIELTVSDTAIIFPFSERTKQTLPKFKTENRIIYLKKRFINQIKNVRLFAWN